MTRFFAYLALLTIALTAIYLHGGKTSSDSETEKHHYNPLFICFENTAFGKIVTNQYTVFRSSR